MGIIRERMTVDLRLAGYSSCTRRNYLMHSRRFVAHFRRSPNELGAEHIREFLFHLLEKWAWANWQNSMLTNWSQQPKPLAPCSAP
jgi:hypothetical protein